MPGTVSVGVASTATDSKSIFDSWQLSKMSQDLNDSGVEGVIVRPFDDMAGLVAETETNAEASAALPGWCPTTTNSSSTRWTSRLPTWAPKTRSEATSPSSAAPTPSPAPPGPLTSRRRGALAIQPSIIDDGFESGHTSNSS